MLTFNEYANERQQNNIKFCENRKKGASKIAVQAKAKGGPAKLTEWHFTAKLPEYDACLKAIKEGKPASYFKEQENYFIKQLSNIQNQRKFQEIMGKAEVWGEVYFKLNT